MTQMKIEERLRTELAEHPQEVMVIVGSGVTLGALYGTDCQARASWGGLIRHGLDEAQGLGLLAESIAEPLQALLADPDPNTWILVAERLSQVLGAPHGGDFRAWLREAVGSFETSIRDRSVLDVLVDLQRRGATLATVNYDGVLEAVTGLRPVTWLQPSEVERVLRRRAEGILHFHGHWEQPESIVLGSASYARVVADPPARGALEAMRMFRTLVFVGHGAGLQDPNWQSFLDWTAEVFSGSEIRHYRVVLEADMASLHDSKMQARRIFPVPYPGTYADLGPFLRSVVPAVEPEPSASVRGSATEAVEADPTVDEPATRHVLMLVNIGNADYTTVSAEEVQKFADLPELAETHEVALTVDLGSIRPRQWREIARALDRLVAKAQRSASESPEPVLFVVAGRAPLPVFTYLGYHTRWLNGRVLLVNQGQGTWDRIGPFSGAYDFPASTRPAFAMAEVETFQTDPGRLALFVGCSNEYAVDRGAVEPLARAEGHALSTLYRIEGLRHRLLDPLTEGDLESLSTLVFEVLGRMAKDQPSSRGLILAISGPTWVGFWLGRMFNANVTAFVDMPNFVCKSYRRALASRMNELRWVEGAPAVLALSAEPDKEARIRAGEGQDALLDAIEAAQGLEARQRVVTIGATKVSKLVERLATVSVDILHVYAHGSEDGRLGLQNDQGLVAPVSAEAFVAALRSTKVEPSLAVAMACHSASLAPALLEVAEMVVATDASVRFRTAVEFVKGFHGALARGSSVQAAFDQAQVHLDLQPGHESRAFTLLCREGVDPTAAVFWPARQR